jgi:uncharacterized protein (DUF3084 family)
LLGLFSLVALLAHRYMAKGEGIVRRAAWYDKARPTFSDALALVRRELLAQEEILRVGAGERHGKSPAGVRRAANRRGLLCGMNG